jgi:Jacalin-like lectin domain
VVQQTIKAGALHAKPFGGDVGDVKRIVQIKVNHGINVDGLQVTYELMNGKLKEMPWVGGRRGERDDTVGPLDFDEEISSIETATGSHDGSPELLRRLAFNTTKGRRFPASGNEYYGRGHTGKTLACTTIEAPRVCGLVGHSGDLVDSIGLRYRDLAEGQHGPMSRNFLLEMEPYLFPSTGSDRDDAQGSTGGGEVVHRRSTTGWYAVGCYA